MAILLIDMPVTKVVQETPDTRTFRLEPPPSFDPDWKPGQFITVNLPEDPKTRRAYSLSSSPLDGPFLEITIKHMGGFGAHVYEVAKEGTVLQVIAPRGKFMLPANPEIPVMLISGGSGVTPYRSMMRYLIQRKLPTRVMNLYSVRIPADIIFRDEFEALCRVNPRRCARRATCVSTTTPQFTLNALPRTTLAVFRPTPPSSISASIVDGTSPPWRSTNARQHA